MILLEKKHKIKGSMCVCLWVCLPREFLQCVLMQIRMMRLRELDNKVVRGLIPKQVFERVWNSV